MKRKDFVVRLVKGSTLLFSVPVILQSCEKNETDGIKDDDDEEEENDDLVLDLNDSKFSNLKNDGGFVVESNIIIANTGNNNFVALSSICTHNGCTIGYSSSENNFPCPCHGSIFSTSGSVLQGPADTSLEQYTATIDGDSLTIK